MHYQSHAISSLIALSPTRRGIPTVGFIDLIAQLRPSFNHAVSMYTPLVNINTPTKGITPCNRPNWGGLWLYLY